MPYIPIPSRKPPPLLALPPRRALLPHSNSADVTGTRSKLPSSPYPPQEQGMRSAAVKKETKQARCSAARYHRYSHFTFCMNNVIATTPLIHKCIQHTLRSKA